MENPAKMDDLGGTTIFGNTHIGAVNIPDMEQAGIYIFRIVATE